MKSFLFIICWLWVVPTAIYAQQKPLKTYRNFPLVLSVQFHSLSFPFKNLESNLKNAGFGLGTEIALGNKHNWAQQFNLVWYRNKAAGNGIALYTQSSWRPTIVSHFYTEVKAGLGALYSFRPIHSYKLENGEWTSVGHQGKWMPILPVGVSLGFNKYSPDTYIAPFISYQLMLTGNYNNVLPVVSNTLIQVGSRIHL